MANYQTRVYENILEMLSNADNPTPLLRLNRTVPYTQAKVYAKLEWYNPFGSVKDRVAAHMIRDASARGLLREGQALVVVLFVDGHGALEVFPRSGAVSLGVVEPAEVLEDRGDLDRVGAVGSLRQGEAALERRSTPPTGAATTTSTTTATERPTTSATVEDRRARHGATST